MAEAELMLQELQYETPVFLRPTGVGAEYDPKNILSEENPPLIPII